MTPAPEMALDFRGQRQCDPR